MNRPHPPAALLAPIGADAFASAPELEAWARATFIEEGSTLENEDHAHLQSATLGFLWTSVTNARAGRVLLGQCEMGSTMGGMGKWARARAAQQLTAWFGDVPDFVVTILAPYAAEASDAELCALVEHELYHAGQERDEFGAPKFTKWGAPKFAMRGHDVEEFVGVVRRYGAYSCDVRALVDAASRPPSVAPVRLAQACGTCALKVA